MSASQLHSHRLQAARLHNALVDEYDRWGGEGIGREKGLDSDGPHVSSTA